jgi:hypothetical protein
MKAASGRARKLTMSQTSSISTPRPWGRPDEGLGQRRIFAQARAVPLGVDDAGRDRVDGDVVGREFLGQADHQAHHPALGGVVAGVMRDAGAKGVGADVDDPAVVRLHHVRQRLVAAPERGP